MIIVTPDGEVSSDIFKSFKTVVTPAFSFDRLMSGGSVLTDRGFTYDTIQSTVTVYDGQPNRISPLFKPLRVSEVYSLPVKFTPGEFVFGPTTPINTPITCGIECGSIKTEGVRLRSYEIKLKTFAHTIFSSAGVLPTSIRVIPDYVFARDVGGTILFSGSGISAINTGKITRKFSFTTAPTSAADMASILRFYYISNRGAIIKSDKAPTLPGVMFPPEFPYPCVFRIVSISDIQQWGTSKRWQAKITLEAAL